MAWHSNMTPEEVWKQIERERDREIMRLRGLASYYANEAAKLEETRRISKKLGLGKENKE